MLSRTKRPERIAELEADLAVPNFPDALHYVWRVFVRLSARRTNGFASNPITWADLVAYQRLTGERFAPWEIALIEELDNLFRVENTKTVKE